MKRTTILITALLATTPTQAEPRRAQKASTLTAVPFAIPVATPVTVIHPGQILYAATPEPLITPEELAEFRRWKLSPFAPRTENQIKSELSQPPATSQLTQHCLRCHTGPAAKANVRLDNLLSEAKRLTAIRTVLTNEMPKDKVLTADQKQNLLLELASQSKPEIELRER